MHSIVHTFLSRPIKLQVNDSFHGQVSKHEDQIAFSFIILF